MTQLQREKKLAGKRKELEVITLSGITQTQRGKYHIISFTCIPSTNSQSNMLNVFFIYSVFLFMVTYRPLVTSVL